MITKKGIITAAKMKDTVTITVHRSLFHPLYKKRYRMSKKFLADTNGQDVGVGDEVLITECRPLSKRKHFKVTEVLKRGPRVSDMKEEVGIESAIHRIKEKPAPSDSSVPSVPSAPSDSSKKS